MKFLTKFTVALGTVCLIGGSAFGQTVNSDSWAATDALGRKVSEYKDAGDKKKDKFIAMFYWTWHQGNDDTTYQVKNISEIVRKYPEAMKDYNHPAWGDKRPGFFFWEQPLLGYYKTTDPWVLRKHAEMLADAGVDAVFFDCTNGSLTWEDSYEALMKTWDQAQKDGVNVPKIAFMLPFGPAPHSLVSLRQLYKDVYKPGRYENLWFVWKGKPCIMAYPDNLTDSPEDRAIRDFFTFRPGQPDYVDGPFPTRKDQWSWLEIYPQHGYIKGPDGGFEQVSVGVAQNTSPDRKGHCGAFNVKDAYGRNFSVLKGFDPRVDGYLYGYNFQEQWSRAFELDPELVFVTGWNEFIAGQWLPEHSWNGFPFSFVDQFDWEHSRDIEPNNEWWDADGNYRGDTYYYQLIQNVRKFKGMTQREYASETKTIKLDSMAAWTDVKPDFRHYKGNAIKRAHAGHADKYYNSSLGRNDIVDAKIARDAEYIYFYVETASAMTSPQDENWMMLFIDIDRNKSTGWEGYDLLVNDGFRSGKSMVKTYDKTGWRKSREAAYRYQGNELMVSVPRSCFGPGKLAFDFHWADGIQKLGDIDEFLLNGDQAPSRRANYRYEED